MRGMLRAWWGGSLGCVVVVIRCEEDTGFGIREVFVVFAPPLVLFYSSDGRLLFVTDGHLFTIWVVFSLQTSVVACVLLLYFVFSRSMFCVAACFLVRMFGGVVMQWWWW